MGTTHLDTPMREDDDISFFVMSHDAPADLQEIAALYEDEARI